MPEGYRDITIVPTAFLVPTTVSLILTDVPTWHISQVHTHTHTHMIFTATRRSKSTKYQEQRQNKVSFVGTKLPYTVHIEKWRLLK